MSEEAVRHAVRRILESSQDDVREIFNSFGGSGSDNWLVRAFLWNAMQSIATED